MRSFKPGECESRLRLIAAMRSFLVLLFGLLAVVASVIQQKTP
jgi:hypothetical protein